MHLSLIIPLLNEAESLPELEAWIRKVCEQNSIDYEILFMDDGSNDGTGARVAGEVGSGPPAADTATRDAIRTRRPTQRTPSGALVVAVPPLPGAQVSGAIRAQRPAAVVPDRAAAGKGR